MNGKITKKEARRARELERQEERADRTPTEQLIRLDAGGYTASRERARLHIKIQEEETILAQATARLMAAVEEKKRTNRKRKNKR
jgi:hypothetical protein